MAVKAFAFTLVLDQLFGLTGFVGLTFGVRVFPPIGGMPSPSACPALHAGWRAYNCA
jgi:hypothetical protein